jgi:hypothetical protein
VTLTAVVANATPGNSQIPTGSVSFYDGTTLLMSGVPLSTTGGVTKATATFMISKPTVGIHSYKAVYSGDTYFSVGSPSAAVSYQVNPGSTTTSLSSTLGFAGVTGQTIVYTATVTVASPSVGPATGSVVFKDSVTGLTLGTAPVNTSGKAVLSYSGFKAGSHSVSAVYTPDANFLTSTSAALPQTIVKASTTVSLSYSTLTALSPVTFTATIGVTAPGSGTPTGTVTFYVDNVLISTVALANGTASLTLPGGLTATTHTIKIMYNGDVNYLSSPSPFSTTLLFSGGRGT